MLKLHFSYTINDDDNVGIQIFETRNGGPDWHTRYGLEVKTFVTCDEALDEMKRCISHYCECEGETYTPWRFVDHNRSLSKDAISKRLGEIALYVRDINFSEQTPTDTGFDIADAAAMIESLNRSINYGRTTHGN